jgi:hypothetical protein
MPCYLSDNRFHILPDQQRRKEDNFLEECNFKFSLCMEIHFLELSLLVCFEGLMSTSSPESTQKGAI